ncbi:MAG: transposase [Deltaproteobacteria bacterium]|nr:transposase [Deltaproteobacteria bacterium]
MYSITRTLTPFVLWRRYRGVTRELHRQGMKVNHKRVLGIMRQEGLLCRKKIRFMVTTDSRHSLRIYPNPVKDIRLTC